MPQTPPLLLSLVLACNVAVALQPPAGGAWVRRPGAGVRHGGQRSSLIVRDAWYVKRTFYEELGLQRSATEDEIKQAYRQKAKECQ